MKLLIASALLGAWLVAPAAGADLATGMMAFDQGDYATALAEWTQLAESGDATAQGLLGMLYRSGEGVRRDTAAAARWYERAAMQGNPYAQYNLGEMYRTGDGVSRDLVLAFVWFALAAEQIPARADGTSSASRARDAVGAQLNDVLLREAKDEVETFEPHPE